MIRMSIGNDLIFIDTFILFKTSLICITNFRSISNILKHAIDINGILDNIIDIIPKILMHDDIVEINKFERININEILLNE